VAFVISALGRLYLPTRLRGSTVSPVENATALVQGASVPGPIWRETMIQALRKVRPTPFTPILTSRFEGCTTGCPPKEPEKDEDEEATGATPTPTPTTSLSPTPTTEP
ncbi:hypothetical protein AB0K18_46680, partial [Nonomuraea sp. NPDC049421]|uniref:hypothetical protein n=1 Tax=Nonomuraea sp. NPDC049421 TaxID=3155275 RepID=UPI003412011F